MSSFGRPGVALLQCEDEDGQPRQYVMEKGLVIDATASEATGTIVAIDTLSNNPQTRARYAGDKWLRVGERINSSPDAPRLVRVHQTEGASEPSPFVKTEATNPFDGLGTKLSNAIPNFNTRLEALAGSHRHLEFTELGRAK